MPSPDTAHSPDGEQPAQSQRRFTFYLLLFALLVAIAGAIWFSYRSRENAAALAAAKSAADTLKKQNVLITGSPAETANLTNRKMNADFVRNLAQLVHLKTLNLMRTGTTDAQLAEMLRNLNLISLVLNETDVTDQGMMALRHMNKLETLLLSSTNVGDAGLAAIGKMKRLTELSLAHTQVTDEGLSDLAGLPDLVRLILDGTEITDQGLVHLASIPELKVLEVREVELTAEGVRNFRKAKPGVNLIR